VLINSSTPRVIDRSQWGTGSTYERANQVGSHPADAALASRRGGQQPDGVRDTAASALRNARFGSMLEKISDPRASDALMRMQGDMADGSADRSSVFAAYDENS
jgi:hypothetical protein